MEGTRCKNNDNVLLFLDKVSRKHRLPTTLLFSVPTSRKLQMFLCVFINFEDKERDNTT